MEIPFQQYREIEEEPPLVIAVDDQEANLELLEAILVTAGYRVITTMDAFKAIKLMESHPVDLAILDVMMPGMTGPRTLIQKGTRKG
ncbi:MAG: response regulator [Deltaproteobacteria bacterium]|nr:response regulator [Deltaproteobacteria bacterium]